MKYIYHHLGLGDHIICNGLVRHFKEKFGEISVFCKEHNYQNVQYMYRDDENITIIPLYDDNSVLNYIHNNGIGNDVIRIGFEMLNNYPNTKFDEVFYNISELPFEYRFSKFKFNRDLEREKMAYDFVNPENEDYIFIHGDLDRNKVRNDLKIIENPNNFGIFDLITIINNAVEVHVMESSIKCLINSYVFDKPSFFYHQYVRGYTELLNSQGKNNFITIY